MTQLEMVLLFSLFVFLAVIIVLIIILHSQGSVLKTLDQRTALMDLSFPENVRTTREGVDKLVSVLVGSKTKGMAGENIVQKLLSVLPASWLETNKRFNNKSVEFSLRLPNGLYLPIDSKLFSTGELIELENGNDIKKNEKKIRDMLVKKAAEVEKYIDPACTYSFGLAVVPDSVYNNFSDINYETWKNHVVFVSYSNLIPYILLIFQTVITTSRNLDMEKLNSGLESVYSDMNALLEECNGRLSQAIVLLQNSKNEISGRVIASKSMVDLIRNSQAAEVPLGS